MMPVRVEADLGEIPKPPVVTRREINFLHTLFLFFFFYYQKTYGPLDFSHVFLFLNCLTLVFTSIRSHSNSFLLQSTTFLCYNFQYFFFSQRSEISLDLFTLAQFVRHWSFRHPRKKFKKVKSANASPCRLSTQQCPSISQWQESLCYYMATQPSSPSFSSFVQQCQEVHLDLHAQVISLH